jgi:hypothetical protein
MSDAAQRLEQALELAELAQEIVEMRLRRLHPQASQAEIEDMLVEWRLERPGAPDGDAFGRVVTLPKR